MKIKIINPKKEKINEYFTRVNPAEEIKEINVASLDKKNFIVFDSSDKEFLRLFSKNNFIVKSQEEALKKLEKFYSEKKIPAGIFADYKNSKVNIPDFIKTIYLKQNLHIFRNISLTLLNYNGNKNSLIPKIKVLAVNGSPRRNGKTKEMLIEEIEKYYTGIYYETSLIDLGNIEECLGCGGHQKNCKKDCVIKDQMKELLPKVLEADILLLSSPVYMDFPTARTIAFLSRLTGETKRNRRIYIGKYASVLTSGWCSGTKAVISGLNNALEMLGFEIQGRSSRENIVLWKDNKTRGGVPYDFYWPE